MAISEEEVVWERCLVEDDFDFGGLFFTLGFFLVAPGGRYVGSRPEDEVDPKGSWKLSPERSSAVGSMWSASRREAVGGRVDRRVGDVPRRSSCR